MRSTSRSSSPSRPEAVAVRMSISGALRRTPRRIRTSRSASAWNLTRMTRSLQFCDQFRVALPRLRVLQFGRSLPFRKVRIDVALIRQVPGKRTVHLFEGQRRITLPPCFRRTCLRETGTRASRGKRACRQRDRHLQRSSRIPSACRLPVYLSPFIVPGARTAVNHWLPCRHPRAKPCRMRAVQVAPLFPG